MEITTQTTAKKHFSNLGFLLLFATLIIYAVQFLTELIIKNIPAISKDANLSFVAGMLPMYIIAYPIIFWMFKKLPVQLTGEKKKMRLIHLLAAFLIGYAGTYICNIIANILTTIIGAIKQSPVDNVVLEMTTNLNPFVNLIIIAVCAPIMEELLFRKTIIDRTAAYGEGISIVFSGLVFGLFHGNLVQFTYAFFIGAFFGFIYIKTKDIKYTIILHMSINLLGSIGTILLNNCGYMEILEATSGELAEAELMAVMMDNLLGLVILLLYVLLLMCFVIVGIALFFINKKKFTLSAGEVTIEKGKRFSTMLLNLGMILYSVFWIVQIILQLVR